MASPRILLLDAEDLAPGEPSGNRFSSVARQLAADGLVVTLATVRNAASKAADAPADREVRFIDIRPPVFPLICGRGRASETTALRRSYAAADQLADEAFEVVIAPLQGGLAQGLLMRRATEPERRAPTIALWCNATSRWRALNEDVALSDVGPLVADALEQVTLRMADALIGPIASVERVRSLGQALPPSIPALLPELDLPAHPQAAAAQPCPVEELVFVGPLTRANGALSFCDAIERLQALGVMQGVKTTFLGSAAAPARAFGEELLGIRAAQWSFRFQMIDECDQRTMLAYLLNPGRLGVFAAEDADDDRLLRAAVRAGGPVLASHGYDATRQGGAARNVCGADGVSLAQALQQMLDGARGTTFPVAQPTDWRGLVQSLTMAERRRPPIIRPPARSVCVGVLHHGREVLPRALRSIASAHGGAAAEVVVIDNSPWPSPHVTSCCSGTASVRVLRTGSVLQPAAYNQFAAEASGDVLIFLDDDNTFAASGIERLLGAFQSGWFDIVVSTLDIVDGDPEKDASSGHFIFLGDAGQAGLFFNGFGDTAMAVRRDAFLGIGGFRDRGHQASGLDWEFLARARAAGLSIGVLHKPAIRYARRIGAQHLEWRKNDAEGARRAVAAAYESALDGPLLARFAQGLQLSRD